MRVNNYYKVLRKWFKKKKKNHKKWIKTLKRSLFRLPQAWCWIIVKAMIYTSAIRGNHEQYRILTHHKKYYRSIKRNRHGLLHRQTVKQGIQSNSIDVAKRNIVTNIFSPQVKIKQINQWAMLLNHLGLSCRVQPLLKIKSCYIFNQLLPTGLLIFIKPLGFSKVSRVESSGVVSTEYEVMIESKKSMGNSQKLTVVSEFVTRSKNKNETIVAREFFEEPAAAADPQKENEDDYGSKDDDDSDEEGFPDWVGKVRTPYISSYFGVYPPTRSCSCKELCGRLRKIKYHWDPWIGKSGYTKIAREDFQAAIQGIRKELIKFLEEFSHDTDSKKIVSNIILRLNEKMSCFQENIDQEKSTDSYKEEIPIKFYIKMEFNQLIEKIFILVKSAGLPVFSDPLDFYSYADVNLDLDEQSVDKPDDASDSNYSGEDLKSQLAASSIEVNSIGFDHDQFFTMLPWEGADQEEKHSALGSGSVDTRVQTVQENTGCNLWGSSKGNLPSWM